MSDTLIPSPEPWAINPEDLKLHKVNGRLEIDGLQNVESIHIKNTKMIPFWVNYKPPNKMPLNPHTGKAAKCNDSSTWSDGNTAKKKGKSLGMQIVPPFIGIDFDNVVKDGVIHPTVLQWIEQFDSYTEFSMNGTGLHTVLMADAAIMDFKGRRLNKCLEDLPIAGIEIYPQNHYFALTFKVVGDRHVIYRRQEAFETFYNDLLRRTAKQPGKKTAKAKSLPPAAARTDDETVVSKASEAKNGAKFKALYDGAYEGYESPSDADMAFCCILAFWTRDPDQIERIWRSSSRNREKLDQKNGNGTYASETIAKALDTVTEEKSYRSSSCDHEDDFDHSRFGYAHIVNEEKASLFYLVDNQWLQSKTNAFNNMFCQGMNGKQKAALHSRLPVAQRLAFMPIADRMITHESGLVELNTYKPAPLQSAPPIDEEKKLLLEWLHTLTGNDPEGLRFLMDWLGRILQRVAAGNIDLLNRTAIVLHGPPGTGKDTLIAMMSHLLGEWNVKIMSPAELKSSFTSNMGNRLLVNGSEWAMADDVKSSEILDKVKPMITDATISIHEKGKSAREVKNYSNFIITSNRTTPIRIEDHTDRRFTIFWGHEKHHRIKEIASKCEYWAKRLGHLLLTRVISCDVTTPYENESRQQVIKLSRQPLDAFVDDLEDLGIDGLFQHVSSFIDERKFQVFREATVATMCLHRRAENNDPSEATFKPRLFSILGGDIPHTLLSLIWHAWLLMNGISKGDKLSHVKAKIIDRIPSAVDKGNTTIMGCSGRFICGLPWTGIEDPPSRNLKIL